MGDSRSKVDASPWAPPGGPPRDCETEGRDPSGIEKTIITGSDPLDDAGAFVAGMEEYARLGIGKVWVGPPGPEPAAWVEKVTEKVVPRLRDL